MLNASRLGWTCIASSLALCVSSPAVSQPVRAEKPARYIEFLARPTSCLVGHSFVQIGSVARDGSMRADATLGLYPSRYPRMDVEALVNAPGRITQTPADTRDRATARYRLDVSEVTYRKALAHGQRLRAEWRRYDLISENCNKVLFEFADRLGLDTRRDMMDLPANVVSHLKVVNGGRSRASWRQAPMKRAPTTR